MKIVDTKGVCPMEALEMVRYLLSVGENFRKDYTKVETTKIDEVISDFIQYFADSQNIKLSHEKLVKTNEEKEWMLEIILLESLVQTRAKEYEKKVTAKGDEIGGFIINDFISYFCKLTENSQ